MVKKKKKKKRERERVVSLMVDGGQDMFLKGRKQK